MKELSILGEVFLINRLALPLLAVYISKIMFVKRKLRLQSCLIEKKERGSKYQLRKRKNN